MRARAHLFLLLLVPLAATATACGKLRKRAGSNAPPSAPPTLVWKDSSLELKELPGAHGSFGISKNLAYEVSFYGLPDGTALAIDGAPAGTGSSVAWTSDMTELIGALTPAQALDYKFKLDPKKTATLTFATGATVSFPLPPQGSSYGLGEALKASLDRPVSFGKLDSAKPAAHTVVLLSPTSEVLGPAQRMSDVDWVALDGPGTERLGKTCSGYKKTGTQGGPEKTFQLKLVDKTVSVVDRATSKVIAKRDFKAKDDCPMMAFSGEAKSYPRTDEIKDWLRDLRSK